MKLACRDFNALDNVALAVQAHSGHSFRFWRAARRDEALRGPARAILDQVGLGARAEIPAGTLARMVLASISTTTSAARLSAVTTAIA